MHLFSVALMFMEMGFVDFAWYWWIPAFVLVIGWLNAFNFMDGINGITVFYALSVLLPLGVLNSLLGFTSPSIIVVTGLAAGVFAFFNARRRAKTFAGDVGSVSMAFILAFLMIQLLLHTGRWEYILFLSVYGVDAVMTITHRLIRRENIFKPHRTHLYQYLANELKIPHVLVSLLYAFTQMLVSLAVILAVQQGFGPALAIGLLVLLPLGYTFAKIRILQRLSTEAVAKARTAR